MNKVWRKFEEAAGMCYLEMIQPESGKDIWDDTFSMLMEIIDNERKRDSKYAPELSELEDSTECQCDISGWLDDYLDELDMEEQYEKLQQTCEKILDLFQWKEDDPSDLKFHIASALGSQGKKEEALAYCQEWYKEDEDNVMAAAALIYAQMGMKNLEEAEQTVKKFLPDDLVCTEENDIIFTAASLLYKANGNKKEERKINKALKAYEKEVERYLMGMDDEDMDFDMFDEYL